MVTRREWRRMTIFPTEQAEEEAPMGREMEERVRRVSAKTLGDSIKDTKKITDGQTTGRVRITAQDSKERERVGTRRTETGC